LAIYTILSCDNKKNTQRQNANISYFFPLFVIQTGFVETLKPQFVPGQVMAGSAAAANLVEEKLSHLQLVQENDNLKSQVNFSYKFFTSRIFLPFSSVFQNYISFCRGHDAQT